MKTKTKRKRFSLAVKKEAASLGERLLGAMADAAAVDNPEDEPHKIVAAFQADRDLKVDGWPGDDTLAALWLLMRPDRVETIDRAVKAAASPVKYKLGRGGFEWLEDEIDGLADCSGFVCWLLGVARRPSSVFDRWISTDSIRADALGDQTMFREVEPHSQPAFVVYGDHKRGGTLRQGHVGLVIEPDTMRGFDCSSSQSKRRGQAITLRDLSYFSRRDATVWCVPVWWS